MPRYLSKLETAREFERKEAARIPAASRPPFTCRPLSGG